MFLSAFGDELAKLAQDEPYSPPPMPRMRLTQGGRLARTQVGGMEPSRAKVVAGAKRRRGRTQALKLMKSPSTRQRGIRAWQSADKAYQTAKTPENIARAKVQRRLAPKPRVTSIGGMKGFAATPMTPEQRRDAYMAKGRAMGTYPPKAPKPQAVASQPVRKR